MTPPETDYTRGIRAAAEFVAQFDRYVAHDYRLSDCILGKFNLIPKSKIRRTKHSGEGAK